MTDPHPASNSSQPDSDPHGVQDDFSHFSFSQGHSKESEAWNDDRFLLTPPIQPTAADPLGQPIYQNNAQAFRANQQAFSDNAQLSSSPESSVALQHDAARLISGLHIRTDVNALRRVNSAQSMESEPRLRSSTSASSLSYRVPSIRAHLHSSAGSVSPGTTLSSPQIAAMLDITPLPSPTTGAFELLRPISRTRSRGSSVSSLRSFILDLNPPAYAAPNYNLGSLSPTSPRRKGYPGLKSPPRSNSADDRRPSIDESHPRSVSDYVPEALAMPKPRHIVVSTGTPAEVNQSSSSMHREEFIGPRRSIAEGLEQVHGHLPVVHKMETTHEDEPAPKRPRLEVFHAKGITSGEPRAYEAIKTLGQGTFSKVYLAVRFIHKDRKDSVDYRQDSMNMAGVKARSRRLVAVKVVEQGPAGGADAERIEVGLQREVEILKAIQHPSLVHLKAFGKDRAGRALLVMNYCPGGDLFEVATKHQEVLVPALVRRIFAELVSAVRYLHQKFIVHRDIKLESTSPKRFCCAYADRVQTSCLTFRFAFTPMFVIGRS